MSMIKNKRDFLLGIVMTAVGLYLLLSNSIVKGFSLFQTKVVLAQAGTYLKIIGGLIVLVSAVVIIRSLRKPLSEEEAAEAKRPLDWMIVGCLAAFFVYLLLMDVLGFLIDTIWVIALITFLLRVREKHIDLHDKKELLKSIGIAVGYSVVLVLVISFMFTKWLNVRLP